MMKLHGVQHLLIGVSRHQALKELIVPGPKIGIIGANQFQDQQEVALWYLKENIRRRRVESSILVVMLDSILEKKEIKFLF